MSLLIDELVYFVAPDMIWTYSVSLLCGFELFILTPEVLWVCSEYLWFWSPPDIGWFMLNVKHLTIGGATEAYI